MEACYGYIGTDAVDRIDLDTPTSELVRAVFRFGDYCIDTALHPALIWFEARGLAMKLGRISGIEPGRHDGYLSLYDAVNVNGRPWGTVILVKVVAWPKCGS